MKPTVADIFRSRGLGLRGYEPTLASRPRSAGVGVGTDVPDAAGVRISMDGKGRWIDNVFIERLWRSVKYEDIYLRAYENGRDLRAGLTRYFDFYNRRRIHQSHDYQTPDEIYCASNASEPLAIAA